MSVEKIKDKIENMTLKDKVYWSKVILSGIATLGCFILTISQVSNSQAWGVALGWSLLLIHFLLVWKVVKVDSTKLGGGPSKILMEGIGTYTFLWLLLKTTVHSTWWISVYGVPIFWP